MSAQSINSNLETQTEQSSQEFAQVQANLWPEVRPGAEIELTLSVVNKADRPEPTIPYRVVADRYVVRLIQDDSRGKTPVSTSQLEKWGVSFEEARNAAESNLRQTEPQITQEEGVTVIAAGEDNAAAHMLHTDFFRKMDLPGDPIMCAPTRKDLFVCGSNDAEGLKYMAYRLAEIESEIPCCCRIPSRLGCENWETWMPAADDESYSLFRSLYISTMSDIYRVQGIVLKRCLPETQPARFVPTLRRTDLQLKQLTSVCVWIDGFDALLPQTDFISFLRQYWQGRAKVIGIAPWASVHQVLSEQMEAQGFYPERWRVRTFPSDKQLQQIEGLRDFREFAESNSD